MNLLETCDKIGVKGFMHPSELEKLAELAVGMEVLEVGSFMGLSAFCMCIGAKNVTCVDTFKANSAGQHQMDNLTTLDAFLAATKRFNNISHFVGTSQEAANIIDRKFDMVFLDAMHTYNDVKADISRWWPRVRAGGVMAFHDYGHDHFPGVKHAVDEALAINGREITLAWVHKSS